MYCAFYHCQKITKLDVGHFVTDKVDDMMYLFNCCYKLQSLDVNSWNTSQVTTMHSTFRQCTTLTTLDLSNWNTSNVTSMYQMFAGSNNLVSLDLSNFDTSSATGTDALLYMLHATNLSMISANDCSIDTINDLIAALFNRNGEKYGKLYVIRNNEHDLMDKVTLDNRNWKAVIYGGNIKAVHLPDKLYQSIGLGNVLLKHIHVGERFL